MMMDAGVLPAYKGGFMTPEVRQRYNAFWAHEKQDRALLFLTVRGNSGMPPARDPQQKWSDIDYLLLANERTTAATRYCADAYPQAWVNLGPGVLSAMMGGGIHFAEDTVWFDGSPQIHSYEDVTRARIDWNNAASRLVTDMTTAFCREGAGRYQVGITDLGGTLDILASLQGTEPLLMDLLDDPEAVKAACDTIDTLWEEAFAQSYAALAPANGGSMSAWIPIYCEKRWYPLQCDVSAMISPDAFARFVLPSLERAARYLDHSIYHLDGVGELPHVDMLLAMERLDGIQWVPGSGKPSVASDTWFPLYERIQTAGKNLVLTGEARTADELLFLLKNLRHDGLFISADLATEEEAIEVERKALEYAKRA